MNHDQVTGELYLKFKKKKDGTSYLANQYYKLPLQVLPPHYQDNDGTVFVYLLNPSGGVMQKDRLLTEIVLEDESKVLVTTPSANKFYRMEEDKAIVTNICKVGKNCVLEYLPEHNVPFAQSKTYQRNSFYLNSTSTLIASDMITPGRTARNEYFQYDYFNSQTKIYVDEKIVACDYMNIEPGKKDIKGIGLLEDKNIIASYYLYKKDFSNEIKKQLDKKMKNFNGIHGGITTITEDLAVIRFLGDNVIEMQNAMGESWDDIRRIMLSKEAVKIRKY